MNIPTNMQIYRRAAKDAKWRKGNWVIDIILLGSAFLCALCGVAVRFRQLGAVNK